MSTPATLAGSGLSAVQAARLTEEMVGIEGYINPYPGFRGTLKYRFSDFIVHEVDRNKQIVRLTDTSAASAEKQLMGDSSNLAEKLSDDERVAALTALIGETQSQKVLELEKLTLSGDKVDQNVVLEPDLDKTKRTAVHQCIRQHFKTLATDSVKVGDSGQTAIRIFFPNGGGGDWSSPGRPNKRHKGNDAIYQGRRQPPPDLKHLKFVLLKENYDTMSAVSTIARLLHINPSVFAYAGTKDKRACTVQHITGHKLDAGRLAGLNKQLRGMALGDFHYCAEPLRLGQLYGNRFGIVLRDADGEPAAVEAACAHLSAHGFVNYYGLQRFGSSGIGTHEVGRAMLRADWAAAAELILRPRPGEREDVTRAREGFAASGDVAAALRALPKWMHVERQVLEGYRAHGRRAHANALQRVPRNMRMMYVHAYQSFLWNRMAAERLRRYDAAAAVEGDLVLVPGPAAGGAAAGDTDEPVDALMDVDAAAAAAEHGLAAAGEDDAGAAGGEEDLPRGGTGAAGGGAGGEGGGEEGGGKGGKGGKTKEHPKKVRRVTAEEAAAKSVSIFEVVLPLAGASVEYPGHAVGDAYKAALAADGVEWERMQALCREYALSGDYRLLMARPEDLTCRFVTYTDPRADLQTTDLQTLREAHGQPAQSRGRPAPTAGAGAGASAGGQAGPTTAAAAEAGSAAAGGDKPAPPAVSDAATQAATASGNATAPAGAAGEDAVSAAAGGGAGGKEEVEGTGKVAAEAKERRAVILEVTLRASCYATMFIRELLKEYSEEAKLGLREH